MSEKLKPCPFCGNELDAKEDDNHVRCRTRYCPNGNHWFNSTVWNNRPIEDALKARIEELEGAIKGMRNIVEYKDATDETKIGSIGETLRGVWHLLEH